ncbi:PKD domain protein [compost metagenome]
MKKRRVLLVTFMLLSILSYGQLTATFTTNVNTNCSGVACGYIGPKILINEIMVTPNFNDGCLCNSANGSNCGEWIELYNPNLCQPIDISCYYLGNGTVDGSGAVRIPPGTIIPPGGFCIVRGSQAAVIPSNLLVQNGGNVVGITPLPSNPGVCSGGTRFWLPNSGSWLGVYDDQGVVQDALAWGDAANVTDAPCVPPPGGGCNNVPALNSFVNIPANRKNQVLILPSSINGVTYARVSDGGAWGNTFQTPTYGVCNAACLQAGTSTCTGTATINVAGGSAPYTFEWNTPTVQFAQTAIGLCPGTYTCEVTDAAGIVQEFSVVIENFEPVVTLTAPDELCLNDPAVVLLGTPVPAGQATGIFTGNGVQGTNFNPQVAGGGVSTVTYTYVDGMGCSNTVTDAITVHPIPLVNLTNIQPSYCVMMQDAAIQGTPAGGQLTGPGVSQNQFHPNQAGVGTFDLVYEYQDANGCSNSVTVTVEVTATAADPVITAPTDLCVDGDEVVIQVSPVGGQMQVDGANAGLNFSPQTYGVGVHDLTYSYVDQDGCVGTGNAAIEVHGLPVLTMNLQAVYCFGAPFVPLQPQPAGGILSGDNVVGGQLNLDQAEQGTYTVKYEFTDQFGCFNSIEGNYIVSESITPGFDYVLDCTRRLTVDADPEDTTYTYTWNFGDVEVVGGPANFFQFGNPESYPVTLTITDELGCSHDVTNVVEIPYSDLVNFLIVTNPVVEGFPVTFQNLLQMEDVVYEWDFGDGNTSDVLHPNHTYDNPGTYLVLLTATDANGCKYTNWKLIVIPEQVYIYVPNAFTPDGDEHNNYFEARITGVNELEVQIFNRWGEQIFRSVNPDFKWDGTYKEQRCPDGIYSYVITYTPLTGPRNTIKGHVSLLR